MKIYFSKIENGFFAESLKQDYIAAGSWPDDAVELTEKEAETYMAKTPPEGKSLSGNNKGRPVWVDIPPLPHAELVEQAEAQKQYLLSEAAESIAPLQDAVELDMATPEEESALKEWKKYRVMLNRVDTSLGADVVWPTPPA